MKEGVTRAERVDRRRWKQLLALTAEVWTWFFKRQNDNRRPPS